MSSFKSKMINTTAVRVEAPKDQGTSERPVYSPEEFIGLDVGSLRTKFPKETAGYDDVTLFNVAMLPDDDLSDSDWAELLSKHQPTKEVSELDGEGLSTLAQSFAARVSEATETAMDTAVSGKEDWQGGPITVRAGLIADFGDELSGFAEPGSKSGNNPDKYQMPVTDSSGKTAMRKTSFYLQFTRGTPKGQAIMTEIAFLKRANNTEAVKDGIPQEILDMTTTARDNQIRYLENRMNTMQAAYKKAMSLHFQCIKMTELVIKVDASGNVNADPALNTRYKAGTVGWSFIYETDEAGEDTEQVINSPAPIMIWERAGYETGTGEPRAIKNQQKVSIGAFLKFKADIAAKAGSTYKALLKTVERKPKTKDTAKTADTKTETVDQFVTRFVESFRFMNEMQSATDPKTLAKLYSVLKSDRDSKDGGELIVSWVEMRNYMDDVCDELQLAAAYTKITARKPELKTVKAAA